MTGVTKISGNPKTPKGQDATSITIEDGKVTLGKNGSSDGVTLGGLKGGTKTGEAVTVDQLTSLGLDPTATAKKPVVTYDSDTKDSITLNSTGTTINNVKAANITSNGNNAVTTGQLADLAGKVGIEIDKTGFKAPTFVAVTAGDKGTGSTTTVTGAVKDLITAVNKGRIFTADNQEDSSTDKKKVTKQLGEILAIETGDFKIKDNKISTESTAVEYTGANIKSVVNEDKIVIGFKSSPELKDLTLKDSSNVVKFALAGDSVLSLTNGKSGNPNTVKLTNLSNGDITTDSKDAINGSQLFGKLSKVAELFGTKNNDDEQPKPISGVTIDPSTGDISVVSGKDKSSGGIDGKGSSNLTEAIENIYTTIGSQATGGLKFNANNNQEKTVALGKTVEIIAGDLSGTDTSYKAENLKTEISQDNDKNKTSIKIGLREDLVANSIGKSLDPTGKTSSNRLRFLDTNKFTLGANIKATGDNSFALGYGKENFETQALGNESIALGNTYTSGTQNVATTANGLRALAIGTGTTSGNTDTIAIGTGANATGNQGISIGTLLIQNGKERGAVGENSIVLGTGEALAKGANAVAIGANAKAEADNSIALGAGAVTATTKSTEVGYFVGDAAGLVDATKKPELGEVSIGSGESGKAQEKTRRITHLAAGKELTDAVNVAQLDSVVQGGLTFIGDAKSETETTAVDPKVAIGKSIEIKGDKNDNAELTTGNIGVISTAATSSANAKLSIKLAKDLTGITSISGAKPTGEEATKIAIGNGNITLSKGEPVEGNPTADKVVLKGLKDDEAGDSAVTRAKFDELEKKLGLNGAKGDKGDAGAAGATGPRGNDGLNGTSIIEKVEALREGLAGNTVYTTEAGDRVAKVEDKYYTIKDIENAMQTAGYKKADDGKYYKTGDFLPDSNQLREPQNAVAADSKVIEKALTTNAKKDIPTSELQLAVVNPNGETTKATTIGNVAGNIGLDTNGIETTLSSEKDAIEKAKEALKVANAMPEDTETEEREKAIKAAEEKLVSANKAYADKFGETKAPEASSKVVDLINKAGNDLTKVATVGDLQTLAVAGMNFDSNGETGGANKTVHKILGAKLGILGGSEYNDTFVGTNIATKVVGGDIVIGMKKTPKFEGLELQAPSAEETNPNPTIKLTPGTDGSLTLSKEPATSGDGKVVLKGLKDGVDGDSAVTKETFDKLKETLGLNGTPGKDGNDGATGPRGNDGLNGTSIIEKVETLREGLAGNTVYTTKDGDRVEKLGDSYYTENQLKDAGFIKKDGKYYSTVEGEENNPLSKDEVIKKLNENTSKKTTSVDELQLTAVNPNGETTTPTTIGNVKSNIALEDTDGIKAAKAELKVAENNLAAAEKVDPKGANIADLTEKVKLAKEALKTAETTESGKAGAVKTLKETLAGVEEEEAKKIKAIEDKLEIAKNADEETRDEENIAALEKQLATAKADAVTAITGAKKNLAEAEKILAGKSSEAAGKVTDLIGKTGNDLTKVATVGDIQTLAVAGLNFGANGTAVDENNATHKVLGAKLGILGKAGNLFNTDFDSVNVATKVVNGDIEIGIKKSPEFNEIVVHGKDGKQGKDGANGKSAIITVDNEGKLSVINGLNGVDGRDGVDGVTGADGKDGKVTEIITKDYLEKEGLIAKDGANGATGPAGRDGINGPAGKDGLNGTNGKDAPTLNEKVNALRNGEAGSVVYTLPDGERVVRDGEKFYKASDLVGKVRDEDGNWYPAGENGKKKEGSSPIEALKENDVNSIQLAAVDKDGSTTTPTTIGNVKSNIALNDTNEIAAAKEAVKAAEEKLAVAAKDPENPDITALKEKLDNEKASLKALEAAEAAKANKITELKAELAKVETAKAEEVKAVEDRLKAAKESAEEEKAAKVAELEKELATAKSEAATAIKEAKGNLVDAEKALLGNKPSEAAGKVADLIGKSGNDLAKVATVGDIQTLAVAGMNFGANGEIDKAETKSVHKILGAKLGILGGSNYVEKDFDFSNISTIVQDGDIKIAFKKAPKFEGLVIGKDGEAGKDAIITVDKDGKLIVKNGANGNDGIDGVNGENGNGSEIITKQTLEGLIGKAGKDGEKGPGGRDAIGKDGADGSTGPAGKDGLNGTPGKDGKDAPTLGEKINALRNGEAGSVVYTLPDGERVVRDGNKFYKADDLVGKVKTKEGNWVEADDDGQPKLNGEVAKAIPSTDIDKIQLAAVSPTGETTTPTTIGNVKSNIALDDTPEVKAAKEKLAEEVKKLTEAENAPNADTNTVEIDKLKAKVKELKGELANAERTAADNVSGAKDVLKAAKDTLAKVEKEEAEKVKAAEAAVKAINDETPAAEKEAAKANLAKVKEEAAKAIADAKEKLVVAEKPFANRASDASSKVADLIGKTGNDLTKVATVGDIQTLAVAGLNFGANGTAVDENNATHKVLGAKLGILGKAGNLFNTDFDSVNVATKVVNGDIEIGIKKSPEFNEIVVHGKDGKNGTDGKSAIITVDNEGKLSVINGLNGINGRDGVDGVAGENGKDGRDGITEIITKDYLEKEGLIAKDGANGAAGPAGRDGKEGPAGKDGLNGTNGKDAPTLNEKVNALRSGEAGSVVYTLPNGDRVVRDGANFYKASELAGKVKVTDASGDKWYNVDKDGKPDMSAEVTPNALGTEDIAKIQLSAVNKDGATTTPTILGNIAAGKVNDNSTDAINGKQLFSVKELFGDNVTVDEATGKLKPTIEAKPGENGKPGTGGIDGKGSSNITNAFTNVYNTIDDKTNLENIKISYKASGFGNDESNVLNVSLAKGFNFANGLNTTATIGPDGRVSFGLNKVITDIEVFMTSLSTDPTKPKDAVVMTGSGLNVLGDAFDTGKGIAASKGATLTKEGVQIFDDKTTQGANYLVGGTTLANFTKDESAKLTSEGLTLTAEPIRNSGDKSEAKFTRAGLSFKDKAGNPTLSINPNDGTISNGKEGVGAKLTLGSTDKNISFNDGKLINLAAGTVSDTSTDGINGSQLYSVKELFGNNVVVDNTSGKLKVKDGKDGLDGKGSTTIGDAITKIYDNLGQNGKDGVAGAAGRDGSGGPAGKDGLNGKDGKDANATTIIEKVNALRNGEAGSVVYTDKDGNRVVRDGNDFYNADKIKDYVKVDGKWYDKTNINPDTGKPKVGKENETIPTATLEAAKVDKDNLQLAAVSPDGETTTPTTIGNVKSNIALDDTTKVKDAKDALAKAEKELKDAATGTPEAKAAEARVKEAEKALAKAEEAEKATEKLGTDIANAKKALADKEAAAKEALAKAEKAVTEAGENTPERAAAEKELANVKKEQAGEVAKAKETLATLEKALDAKAGNASDKVVELVGKTGNDLNKAATVGDIQTLAVAGMNFGANGTAENTDNATHKILGAKLGIIGKAGNYFDEAYDSANIATKVVNGDIEIGIKKSPEFNEIVVHGKDGKNGTDGKSAIITVDDNGNLAVKNGLNGVDGKDGVDGVNGKDAKTTEIITKDYLEKEGLIAKDGANGVAGPAGRDGSAGPAGKDGLNGTNGKDAPTLNEKVNALRNGEAGAVVYTDGDGNRVVRDGDKFYKADDIKGYVKTADGFVKVGADGKPTTEKISAEALEKAEVAKDKLQLTAVGPTGETKDPVALRNVASVLVDKDADIKEKTAKVNDANNNLTKAATDVAMKSAEVNSLETALENLKAGGMNDENPAVKLTKEALDKAKEELANNVKDLGNKQTALNNAQKELKEATERPVEKLLAAEGNTLNNAATVGDLQAVAAAGLDFVTNDGEGNTIHKNLGSALKVEGKSGAKYDEAKYSSDNLVTTNDNGILRVAMLRSPMFDGVTFKDTSGKGSDITIINNGGALDLGGTVLRGLKDDPKAEDSAVTTRALNKAIGDLKETGFTIVLNGDENKSINVQLGDTINIQERNNIDIIGKDFRKPGVNPATIATEEVTETAKSETAKPEVKESTVAKADTATTTLISENPKDIHEVDIALKPEIKVENITVENKDGNKTIITPNTVTTDTVVAKKEVKVGPDKDKDGNDVEGTTTTITKDGGITVSTKSKEKVKEEKDGKEVVKEVVKETSKVVINDGAISGLKDVTLDENGMVTEGDQGKAVNGGTLNQSMTILREQVSGGFEQVNNRITNVERRVQKVERNLQRGVANSIAQAGVKFQEIGKNQATVGAAVGSYKGQQAVAVGLQAAPTENVRVHGIISVSPNDVSESAVSVGASWKFDLK